MSESYPEVRNFWDDLDKAFHEWAYLTLSSYLDAYDSATNDNYVSISLSENPKPNINGSVSFRWSFGPHSARGSIESTTILTTHPSLYTLIPVYCSMHFHAQNCTQCDDLCEIQNLEPCRKIWTDLSDECCQTCNLFVATCEVDECLIETSSSTGTNFRDSKSFYVLVTLLPICGFIGRGSY